MSWLICLWRETQQSPIQIIKVMSNKIIPKNKINQNALQWHQNYKLVQAKPNLVCAEAKERSPKRSVNLYLKGLGLFFLRLIDKSSPCQAEEEKGYSNHHCKRKQGFLFLKRCELTPIRGLIKEPALANMCFPPKRLEATAVKALCPQVHMSVQCMATLAGACRVVENTEVTCHLDLSQRPLKNLSGT